MRYVYQTDKGKVRELNEDAVAVFPGDTGLLAVVADGMGGHKAGDVASNLTIEQFEKLWSNVDSPINEIDTQKWLTDSIKQVNNIVYEKAQAEDAYQGMGTTVVAAICTERELTVAHIGDSRAYLFNQTNWKQVTNDHSLVGELVRTGQLSEEDAQVHPKRNMILKALGTEFDLAPDIYRSDWNDFEQLLICSDGLTNKISDEELHELILTTPKEDISQTLIDIANERGGEDNITLTIISHQEKVGESSC
ncbi:Stp1/IreP family PP2C-type Ser/Thr phosphatase [Gracilibacillus sp. S3-1-1]|uniref:Stp1/IreP family PP2C-type Ser/Thr phosphatase n=1 Tax=Gracilibacillus pellucidus TaxID=3095368 RepID=A0ACC6M243_9BACI|nr:Stp1/IreP family PP2C-type Ser/Thr phosphatase [Gracilibacillus sp. S3-1-1]MDX8045007.1 Stp1/IreP family PP2C-type Ser/Thr phosphatase [Gracilibacillus sp. S3-1-1]